MNLSCISLLVLALALASSAAPSEAKVFPKPRQMRLSGGQFLLDSNVSIILSVKTSEAESRLANLLAAELSSRHGFAIRRESVERLPAGRRFILIGAVSNPLVKGYCAAHRLEVSASDPGPEGYLLSVTPDAVVIAGSDNAGAFYGLQSLRQLVESEDGGQRIPGVQIRDWPYSSFRGIKLYLPGRENIGFFRRFVRDYMALYKYNKLVIEMNAAMRLNRHPELNAGSIDMARELRWRRLNNPPGLWFHEPNSSHYDVADSGILEQQEVGELVRWAEENYIEVIPELPSLTHSYYLLARHRELAEVPQEEWPDTYCPSIAGVYDLLFDVYDEYIAVMHPKMVHIGHDEWRMPWGVCPRCRGKDPSELFAHDVNRIHDYLKRKGIRMAMWNDHLIEDARGARLSKPWWDAPGYDYRIPGALSPEQVKGLIPKDTLLFNWLWDRSEDDPKYSPVINEERLSEWGFQQIYGNFGTSITNFKGRTQRSKIAGGAPSAWMATTEFNFGKDVMADFTGCAELLWSGRERGPAERAEVLSSLMPTIRRNLSASDQPSMSNPMVPIDIGANLNSSVPGLDPAAWRAGRAGRGRLTFSVADPAAHAGRFALIAGSQGEGKDLYAQHPNAIPIGMDVTSLVFLHALAKPAGTAQGYRRIYDFEDSSDLVGWYEVEYEDGFVATVPLRYQWNILDLKNASGAVAYQADALECGGATFYAFEWINPRLGVVIKEIRLIGSTRFKNPEGVTIPSNAIMLLAVSAVTKRDKPFTESPLFPR